MVLLLPLMGTTKSTNNRDNRETPSNHRETDTIYFPFPSSNSTSSGLLLRILLRPRIRYDKGTRVTLRSPLSEWSGWESVCGFLPKVPGKVESLQEVSNNSFINNFRRRLGQKVVTHLPVSREGLSFVIYSICSFTYIKQVPSTHDVFSVSVRLFPSHSHDRQPPLQL